MINEKCVMCDKKAIIYITVKNQKRASCKCCYDSYKLAISKCK